MYHHPNQTDNVDSPSSSVICVPSATHGMGRGRGGFTGVVPRKTHHTTTNQECEQGTRTAGHTPQISKQQRREVSRSVSANANQANKEQHEKKSTHTSTYKTEKKEKQDNVTAQTHGTKFIPGSIYVCFGDDFLLTGQTVRSLVLAWFYSCRLLFGRVAALWWDHQLRKDGLFFLLPPSFPVLLLFFQQHVALALLLLEDRKSTRRTPVT